MSQMKYDNFVKPSSIHENNKTRQNKSGKEVRQLYLEEIQDNKRPTVLDNHILLNKTCKKTRKEVQLSDKELFIAVQNNDVDTLIEAFDNCPDKINTLDSYGWSLLMIACQANSVETVKLLLERGIDTSVRDKAGNSARSLVIKNRSLELVDLLLKHSHHEKLDVESNETMKKRNQFKCALCDNKIFSDKDEHLSSTIHNINASKGKKIPASYIIPPSNKGYQIMLKTGWDRESGLGRDGSGNKYPIKAIQKKDRKGLGNVKRKTEVEKEDTTKHKHRKMLHKEYHHNRKMEINFRRQFY